MYLRSALGDPVRLQEEQSTSATDELCIGLERICPRLSDGRKASRPAEEADRHAFVRDVLVYVDHRRNELIVPACGVRLDIPLTLFGSTYLRLSREVLRIEGMGVSEEISSLSSTNHP